MAVAEVPNGGGQQPAVPCQQSMGRVHGLSEENKMEVHGPLRIICSKSVERHDYQADNEADLLAPKSRIPVWTIGLSQTHGLLVRH